MSAGIIQLIIGAVCLLVLIILYGIMGWKSKIYRLIVALFILGLAAVWIYPTYKWYFVLDEGTRDMVNIPLDKSEDVEIDKAKLSSIKEYITEINKNVENMREILDRNKNLYRYPEVKTRRQEKEIEALLDIRTTNKFNVAIDVDTYKFDINKETLKNNILPKTALTEEQLRDHMIEEELKELRARSDSGEEGSNFNEDYIYSRNQVMWEIYEDLAEWKIQYLNEDTDEYNIDKTEIENKIETEMRAKNQEEEEEEETTEEEIDKTSREFKRNFNIEYNKKIAKVNEELNTVAETSLSGDDYKKYQEELKQKVIELKTNTFYEEINRAINLREELLKIEDLKKLKKQTVNLGLDLAGGISFTLDVDEETLRSDVIQQNISMIDEDLIRKSEEMKTNIKVWKEEYYEKIINNMEENEKEKIKQEVIDEGIEEDSEEFDTKYQEKLQQRAEEIFNNNEYKVNDKGEQVDEGGKTYQQRLEEKIQREVKRKSKEGEEYIEKSINYLREETKKDALTILKKRINQFGVSEPEIGKTLGNRPLVQLPGADDPASARKMVTEAGKLEFRIVDDDVMNSIKAIRNYKMLIDYKEYPTARLLYEELRRLNPELNIEYIADADKVRIISDTGNSEDDSYAYQQAHVDKRGQREVEGWIFIKNKVELSGKHIINPRVQMPGQQSTTTNPYISFELDNKGTDIFAKVTKENKGKRLAIILDGYVQSAPTIQDQIIGRGSITGNFNVKSARELVSILKAGSISSKLEIVSENLIGPKLGAENIKRGIMATIIGLSLVMLFMLVWYKLGGLFANIALFLNLYLLISILSMFHFTLTLPGIAGILLTIGMAVDANVLIFERIKEELRNGKPLTAAVDEGYGKAFWTIFDANLTTIFAAIVLSQVGTGVLKGFGVTLAIGIASSMFTALVISKLFIDVMIVLTKGKMNKEKHKVWWL
jgi:protein-export membrane protein SecD